MPWRSPRPSSSIPWALQQSGEGRSKTIQIEDEFEIEFDLIAGAFALAVIAVAGGFILSRSCRMPPIALAGATLATYKTFRTS
jgi:hypothetical protein